MSLEKNKAIIRRWIEADNKKDLAVLDELIAADYFDPSLQVRGLESYKQVLTMVFKGFPDWHETIEDIIAEGDKVWVLEKVTGTHTGELEFLGSTFAPTGKKITMTAVCIWRIVDGKVAEKESEVYDFLDFYKQLGVIEYTEKAKKLFPQDVK
jgi:predicted ester cyclase